MAKCCAFCTNYVTRGEATRIEYSIRVNETTFMNVGPTEITDLISQGFTPEIRVMGAK